MSNREKFIRAYGILNQAAIGVTFIRTREPIRAEDAIREWAFTNKKAYRKWSMLSGWNVYDAIDPEKAPTLLPNTKPILPAIDMICNLSGSASPVGGKPNKGFPEGVFTMFWPHFMVPKVPELMQHVLELSEVCVEEVKRVALIVPPHFELPAELMDAAPIIDFELPDRSEMEDSYHRVAEHIRPEKRPVFSEADIDKVLNAISGMTQFEAESAIARSFAENNSLLPGITVDQFCKILLAVKTEALKRTNTLELMPVGTMEDVGGLGELKEWLSLRRSAFGKKAREAGVDRPRGILLVGAPGVGKSLVAKATAYQLGTPLIKFDIGKVYGGIVGSSEAKIRMTLEMLAAMAPAVVLWDEIDKSVHQNSNTNDGGISQRLLGAILTFMQESTAEVFWVITANRTQNLPSELVRKGRLDEVFSVLMPSEDERREIFKIHLAKRRENYDNVPGIAEALEASADRVGAEIEAAVAEAKLYAYANELPMHGEFITKQLSLAKPISVAFKEDFDAMSAWAANNARPASIAAKEQSKAGAAVGRTRSRTRSMQPSDTSSLDG